MALKNRYETRVPLLVIFPLVAVVAVMLWGYDTFEHEATPRGSFPVDAAVRTVEIVSDVGNVDVILGPPGKVSFRAKTLIAAGSAEALAAAQQSPLTFSRTDSGDPTVLRLVVSPFPDGFAPLPRPEGDERPGLFREIDSVFEVPVDIGVVVRARDGSIRIDTRQAEASVFTAAGTVMVLHTSAAVTIHNGDGTSLLVEHRGGPVQMRVRGKTRATFAQVAADVDIENAEGEVIVVLPRQTSCVLDARSSTGNVRNAFGLATTKVGAGSVVAGTLGDGGPKVRIDASAGTVTIDAAADR